MPSSEHKTVQTGILEYVKTEGVLLGQFRYTHTDILTLMINCKNTNRDEAIPFGVSGSQILRQGVANIHEGIVDEKWRRAVAKLVGTYLKQDIPENLSQPVRDLSLSSRHHVAILKCYRFMESIKPGTETHVYSLRTQNHPEPPCRA